MFPLLKIIIFREGGEVFVQVPSSVPQQDFLTGEIEKSMLQKIKR